MNYAPMVPGGRNGPGAETVEAVRRSFHLKGKLTRRERARRSQYLYELEKEEKDYD